MQTYRHHFYFLPRSHLSAGWQRQMLRRQICVLVILLAAIMLGSTTLLAIQGQVQPFALAADLLSSHASGSCQPGANPYSVQGGDTLSAIAARYHTGVTTLANYNHLSDPNLIFIQQTICIPGQQSSPPSTNTTSNSSSTSMTPVAVGNDNPYAYGECTWWADQGYYDHHGVFVPWSTNADAWEWTQRAKDFGWQVSATPQQWDIIDLQPWVQGAYNLGHVALVEQVLPDGSVMASNMNWAGHGTQLVDVRFKPGPGVTFIRQ